MRRDLVAGLASNTYLTPVSVKSVREDDLAETEEDDDDEPEAPPAAPRRAPPPAAPARDSETSELGTP